MKAKCYPALFIARALAKALAFANRGVASHDVSTQLVAPLSHFPFSQPSMISDLLAIYKARRDPALATRLAAKLVQTQAMDRALAPLFIVHVLSWIAIGLCGILSIAGIGGAIFGHWSIIIPTLIPIGLGIGFWKLRTGLSAGEARIRALADAMTSQSLDRVVPLASQDPAQDLPSDLTD